MPTRDLNDGERYELQAMLAAPGKAGAKGTYNGCEWKRAKVGDETAWSVRDVGEPAWTACATEDAVVSFIVGAGVRPLYRPTRW